ncbi:hypothetical protein PQR34_45170 [Paraburkholderia sediminicola]|uniref:hypothetical protein n=1 Tax=Paraburkholderia sediminicola TaxID=458836 RepID=UPI0038BC0CEE
MPQSVNGNLEKQDDLVRIGPNAVFHRDVFLPVVPPPGNTPAATQSRRRPPDAQPGLSLDFDDE